MNVRFGLWTLTPHPLPLPQAGQRSQLRPVNTSARGTLNSVAGRRRPWGVEQPVTQQFGHYVDQARPAKPRRRHVADHVDAQAAVEH